MKWRRIVPLVTFQEVPDCLLLPFFDKLEIGGGEALDEIAAAIDDGHAEVDEIDAAAKNLLRAEVRTDQQRRGQYEPGGERGAQSRRPAASFSQ